jgi:hypothetical protein
VAVTGVTASSSPSISIIVDGVADRQVFAESATGSTLTQVAQSPTSVTLLAANSSNLRQGASVFNDSVTLLYVALSASAASATVHTVQVSPGGLYETPKGWQGAVTGIWASSGAGAARVTELVF